MRKGDNARPLDGIDWPYRRRTCWCERFIPGRELTVAVMGDRALAVTELTPDSGFYDYDGQIHRRRDRASHARRRCRRQSPTKRMRMALARAPGAGLPRRHRAADFRYDDTEGGEPGKLYLLEINTQPGMTPLSLVPEQAPHLGISFPELCAWMVEHAACDA